MKPGTCVRKLGMFIEFLRACFICLQLAMRGQQRRQPPAAATLHGEAWRTPMLLQLVHVRLRRAHRGPSLTCGSLQLGVLGLSHALSCGACLGWTRADVHGVRAWGRRVALQGSKLLAATVPMTRLLLGGRATQQGMQLTLPPAQARVRQLRLAGVIASRPPKAGHGDPSLRARTCGVLQQLQGAPEGPAAQAHSQQAAPVPQGTLAERRLLRQYQAALRVARRRQGSPGRAWADPEPDIRSGGVSGYVHGGEDVSAQGSAGTGTGAEAGGGCTVTGRALLWQGQGRGSATHSARARPLHCRSMRAPACLTRPCPSIRTVRLPALARRG